MPLDAEIKTRVSEEMKDKLEAIAKAQGGGVKVAVVVRQAIERYLREIEEENRLKDTAATYNQRSRKAS